MWGIAFRQRERCQQLRELEKKLLAVLEGKDQLASAEERRELAELCQRPHQRRYAAAVRFYAEAFAAQPNWSELLQARYRHQAAHAAILALSGQGRDADPLDDQHKAQLNRQALEWFRTAVAWQIRHLTSPRPEERAAARQLLRRWQHDPDLAAVRDAAPPAWQSLWQEIATSLAVFWRNSLTPQTPSGYTLVR